VAHHSGIERRPSRDTVHAAAAEIRDGPTEKSRPRAAGAARSLARLNPRDSRNIAIALALLAFAVIMYLVTIVKLEEQLHRSGMSLVRWHKIAAFNPDEMPFRAAATRKAALGPFIR
jgi:type II secretory pathway component PulM